MTIRYRYRPLRPAESGAPPSRWTLWVLIVVVVGSILALTFGHAEGSGLFGP